MHWDDAARKLTVAQRRGAFPGMKTKRRFKVVVVGQVDKGGNATDLVYDGRAVTIKQ
jgi:alpha-D-xyloside xylohydrolase